MKKSKAIELLKAQTHSIKMDRREGKDVQLLSDILREALSGDITIPIVTGKRAFYFIRHDNFNTWYSDSDNPKFGYINISEIEVDDEFVNGEEVEVSDNGDEWIAPFFYIGKARNGTFVCQAHNEFISKFPYIRKTQTERDKAIQTIKELKEKFNIKNEEV
jgi:hypothetical protein